jgi:hypothetical protein
MKIPKSFELGSHIIKVIVDSKLMIAKDRWGEAGLIKNNIIISTIHSDQTKITNSMILHTFYHEKIHHILNTMGEKDLCNNEKFVDIFANLLLQSDLSAKYK